MKYTQIMNNGDEEIEPLTLSLKGTYILKHDISCTGPLFIRPTSFTISCHLVYGTTNGRLNSRPTYKLAEKAC